MSQEVCVQVGVAGWKAVADQVKAIQYSTAQHSQEVVWQSSNLNLGCRAVLPAVRHIICYLQYQAMTIEKTDQAEACVVQKKLNVLQRTDCLCPV